MVMAQSLYKALVLHSNPVEIHVVAPLWSRDLLLRMPEITRIHGLDVAHGEAGLKKRYLMGKYMRKERYSKALVLPRSFKSALIPYFAKIPIRVGELGESRYGLINHVLISNKDKHLPTSCNYLRFADVNADITQVKKNYAPKLTVNQQNQQILLKRYQFTRTRPLIACMVGAEYGPSKQWPADHFARLINMLTDQGLDVCIFGSGKDVVIAEKIQRLCRHPVYNLCGKTSLLDAVDLLAVCDVAVTNDSGLMHIAAAVDLPVVAMYGATSPSYTPPLHPRARIFHMKLACSPCWQRSCQYHHYRCLTDILPGDVFDAVIDRL